MGIVFIVTDQAKRQRRVAGSLRAALKPHISPRVWAFPACPSDECNDIGGLIENDYHFRL
jgi:hypothetical protein